MSLTQHLIFWPAMVVGFVLVYAMICACHDRRHGVQDGTQPEDAARIRNKMAEDQPYDFQ